MAGGTEIRGLTAKVDFEYDLAGLDRLDQSFNNAESRIRELGSSVNQLGGTLDNLGRNGTNGLDQVGGSTDHLNAKIEELRREAEKLQRQLEEAGKAGKNGMDDIADAGKKASSDTKGFTEELSTRLEGVIPIFGRLRGAASTAGAGMTASIAAVTVGVVALGLAVAKVAEELEVKFDKASAMIGATAQETSLIKQAALDAFRSGFGEGIDDAITSVAMVRQDLQNLADKDVSKVAEGAMLIRDTWGPEVEETTNAIRVMAASFEGLKETDAMDLLTTGFQEAGTAAREDLIDTMKEYSPMMGKAGKSAQEFTGSLIKGIREGGRNTDLLADAMTEFGILMTDTGSNAGPALEKLGFDSKKLQANFAQGGEKGRWAFNAVTAALSMVKDPLEQNMLGVQLMGTQWEMSGAKIVTAMNHGNDAVAGFRGATERAADTIQSNFTSKVGIAGREIQAAFYQKVIDSGLAITLSKLGDKVLELTPLIIDGMNWMFDSLQSIFVDGNGGVSAGVNTLVVIFQNAVQFISAVWWLIGPAIVEPVKSAFNLIINSATYALDIFNNLLMFATNLMVGNWGAAWDNMATIIADVVGGFYDVVANALDLVYTVIETTLGRAIDYIFGIDLTQAGRNIIDGLVNGIKEKSKELVAYVQSTAADMKNAFTGFFDMHSPSRVMEELGGFFSKGVTIGVRKEAPAAVQSVEDMSKNMYGAANERMPVYNSSNQASPQVDSTGGAVPQRGGVHIGNIAITVERGADGSAPSEQDIHNAIESYFRRLNMGFA